MTARVSPSPTAPPLRWTAGRKLDVLNQIAGGQLTRAQALDAYQISDAELDAWTAAWDRGGTHALKVTVTRESRP